MDNHTPEIPTSRLLRKSLVIDNNLSGGLLGLIDYTVMLYLRVDDNQYNFICEKSTDEELDLLLEKEPSFSKKRIIIKSLESILSSYKPENIK